MMRDCIRFCNECLELCRTCVALLTGGSAFAHYLYHAVRADILRRLHRPAEAAEAYKRALSLTANAVERRYLRHRLGASE